MSEVRASQWRACADLMRQKALEFDELATQAQERETAAMARIERDTLHIISRFDEITDRLAPLCRDTTVNDGYRLIFALKDRLRAVDNTDLFS